MASAAQKPTKRGSSLFHYRTFRIMQQKPVMKKKIFLFIYNWNILPVIAFHVYYRNACFQIPNTAPFDALSGRAQSECKIDCLMELKHTISINCPKVHATSNHPIALNNNNDMLIIRRTQHTNVHHYVTHAATIPFPILCCWIDNLAHLRWVVCL